MTISLDISCRECQLSGSHLTRGAYNLFGCADCRARYLLDCVVRLSPTQAEAERTKDKLFEALAMGRS